MSVGLVILDDRDVKNMADAFGLNILSVIGVLIWAWKKRLIPTLKDELIVSIRLSTP